LNREGFGDPRKAWNEIEQRIGHAREEFSEAFVGRIAPSIVREENAGAEQAILGRLKEFMPEVGRFASQDTLAQPSAGAWRPSTLRTLFGAAFGAAAALLLLWWIQGPVSRPSAAGPVPQAAQQAKQAATAKDAQPAPAVAPSATPTEGAGAQPQPAARPPAAQAPSAWSREIGYADMVLMIAAAAFGAGFGAFLMICPPLSRLRAFMEKVVKVAAITAMLGALLRGLKGKLITAGSAVVSAIGGIWAATSGSVVLLVLFMLVAVLTIVLVRVIPSDVVGSPHQTLVGAAVDAFDRRLKAASAEWCALAAALISRPWQGQAVSGGKELQQVKEAILIGREQSRPPDRTLRIVEQILDIGGPRPPPPPPEAEVFTWQTSQHSALFEKHGIIRDDDPVEVIEPPLFDGKGRQAQNVVRRGRVYKQQR